MQYWVGDKTVLARYSMHASPKRRQRLLLVFFRRGSITSRRENADIRELSGNLPELLEFAATREKGTKAPAKQQHSLLLLPWQNTGTLRAARTQEMFLKVFRSSFGSRTPTSCTQRILCKLQNESNILNSCSRLTQQWVDATMWLRLVSPFWLRSYAKNPK